MERDQSYMFQHRQPRSSLPIPARQGALPWGQLFVLTPGTAYNLLMGRGGRTGGQWETAEQGECTLPHSPSSFPRLGAIDLGAFLQ